MIENKIKDIHYLIKTNNLEEARNNIYKLLENNPQDYDLINLIGLVEAKKENYKNAIDFFKQTIVINPKLTILDEEQQGYWEGCLSVPGLRGFVKRPRKIKVEFVDIEMEKQVLTLEGFLATVFQHELDHLFGRLYIDHIEDKTLLTYEEEFYQFYSDQDSIE